MSEIAFKLSQICNVMLGVRFPHDPGNVTGTLSAASFADPDGHHLSIFSTGHK